MKPFNFIFLAICLTLVLVSCSKPETAFDPDAIFCNEDNCDNSSCAIEYTKGEFITCDLSNDDDIDWFVFTITQEDVDLNFGLYTVDITNNASEASIKLSVFGDQSETDLLLELNPEAGNSSVNGLQFTAPGVHLIKIEKTDNKNQDVGYRFFVGV